MSSPELSPSPFEWIDQLCLTAREHNASDLFLADDQIPQLRIGGELQQVGEDAMPPELFRDFWLHCGGGDETLDFDTAYVDSNGGRFRVNLHRTMGVRGAVLRQIKTEMPTLESLGLPVDLLTGWLRRKGGLLLVTGATGSGKSTTLAACLEWLNLNYSRHVVTIEDPVEFLFTPKTCLFTQREVGRDTPSFVEGLRRALRQSPDVILVGEIRDAQTAMIALQAAETGHLVLATLHSSSTTDTVERLTRLASSEERETALMVLSQQLIGVMCQRLLPNVNGGLALAVEHFENEAATRKWIIEGKTKELSDFINRGDNPKNLGFLNSLVALTKGGLIAEETAIAASGSAQDFSRAMRGISSGSAGLTARR